MKEPNLLDKEMLKELLSTVDAVKINYSKEKVDVNSDCIESFLSLTELTLDEVPFLSRGGYRPFIICFEKEEKVFSMSFSRRSKCFCIYDYKEVYEVKNLIGIVKNKEELNDWFQVHSLCWD